MLTSHHHSSHGTAHGLDSWLGRVNPRARVLTAVAFALLAAAASRPSTLAAGLAVAVLGLTVSGVSPAAAVRRLLPLELLVVLLAGLLPLMTPGTPWLELGPLASSREGAMLAGLIALKANAIVLGLLALLGSMDGPTLGHALNHVYVPDKLSHLLLFTVRYLDVLHREYVRLRTAMKVRGFRPRVNLHTYRAFGYVVGMLLVRSFDRSERIMAAMKCRGFHGHFYLLDHFAFSARRDLPFCAAAVATLASLACLEWL